MAVCFSIFLAVGVLVAMLAAVLRCGAREAQAKKWSELDNTKIVP